MKRRFSTKQKQDLGAALNLTTMVDIFVILLVFLLMNFSNSTSTLIQPTGILLPNVKKAEVPPDSLKLEIRKDGIHVDGRLITKLENFSFNETDLLDDSASKLLVASLEEQKKREVVSDSEGTNRNLAQDTQSISSSRILLLADSATPYSSIKTILSSAARTGYVDLKLVVIERR